MLQSQCNRRLLIRGHRSFFYGRLFFTSHPYNTVYLITTFLSSSLWWQTLLIGRYIRTHISISLGFSTDKFVLRKLGQSQMDIMLDGYIAQTLTPLLTEKYLKILMSSLERKSGSLFVFNNQWVVARSTLTQQQKRRRANDYATNTVYEIFDRKVDLSAGTIVPQPSVIGVSKKTGVLSPTFFIQRDGTLGIPYEFPFSGRYVLHNANALAPTVLKREKQNARIRLQVSTPSPARCPLGKVLVYVFGH